MPRFIAAEALRAAVQRLQEAGVKPRLCDFLVLKRCVARSGQDVVTLSMNDANFRSSVEDLYRCAGEVYFNPFGTAAEGITRGYRTKKIVSNGTADSVSQEHWRSILQKHNTSPRSVTFAGYDYADLDALLVSNAESRPMLQDAALWFFRHTDVSGLLDGQDDADVLLSQLTRHFIEQCGLRESDRQLFSADRVIPAVVFHGGEAEPTTYLPPRDVGIELSEPEPSPVANTHTFERSANLEVLIDSIRKSGFIFEPWQIAAYVTALRTKPFVILAGVTGTGKSRLPRLVANLTGSKAALIPVQPDWTDSSQLLGYVDIQQRFRAGQLLSIAKRAEEDRETHWIAILDEMNLARVEQYLAEVLSRIEARFPVPSGGFRSEPLVTVDLRAEDTKWLSTSFEPNLSIVGTVNMDEASHGFSRKVLDRAFTLELSDMDITAWQTAAQNVTPANWPVEAWFPRATSLPMLAGATSSQENDRIAQIIEVLEISNRILSQAQLQFGYRTRDEVTLFAIHAEEVRSSFRDSAGDVDPLDLALMMKLLPRIIGGSGLVRKVVHQLLAWSVTGEPSANDDDAKKIGETWDKAGRTTVFTGARYPRTAARLALMWERFAVEGFTSFWL